MDRAEWLAWRHSGIGSSDAAAVHNESPYKTAHGLWSEKTAEKAVESESNFILQKGNDLEPKARALYAAMHNMEHGVNESFGAKLLVMRDLPFMRASLDGSSNDGKHIIEIKYQGKDAHEAVKEGKVPRHYFIQIQHQLLVSGADVATLVSYNGETMTTTSVLPDPEFMQLHLQKCSEFWASVVNKVEPPLSEKDYKQLRKAGARELVAVWKYKKSQLEQLAAEIEEVREKILALVDHDRMICNGISIVKYAGNKGSVDYTKILKLPEVSQLNIDVEKFRKPNGKPFYKMEIIKNGNEQ